MLKGAYARTLENDLPTGRIKVKRNHQFLIGRPVHAEEDTKGLLTVSEISKTPLGDETLILVQDGVIDEMSIGFRTEEKGYTTVDGRRVREIKAAKLREWSFMDDKAANDLAVVTGLKSLASECKSLSDVSDVLYQMQDTLSALRRLSYTPAHISKRLTALMTEMDDISTSASKVDDVNIGDSGNATAASTLQDPKASSDDVALRELLSNLRSQLVAT